MNLPLTETFVKGNLYDFENYGVVIFNRIEDRKVYFFILKECREDWHYFTYFQDTSREVG
jgi:hypothetical protein